MSWQVRIASPEGKTLGAGLLMANGRVLTCAHVLQLTDRVQLDFPGAADVGPVLATVIWRGPWRHPGDRGDVALVEPDSVPRGAAPCEFARLDALHPREGGSSHDLFARGFPPRVQPGGVHVPMRCDARRRLRDEWLRTDTDKPHLERLAVGFGGAGLYLQETGAVVGLLAEDEAGGYDGRMLPLATIRRYWPELDDLLPFSWLVSGTCRAKLREAVEGAEVAASLRSIITAALDLTCKEELTTPWDAICFVGESRGDNESIRTFLVALAPHLPRAARSRLAMWARRWKPDWATEIKHAEPLAMSIVITLRTPTRDGQRQVEIEAQSFADGRWVGGEQPVLIKRDQLREKAQQLISAQVRKLRPVKFMVEFATGLEELTLPFDEWYYEEPSSLGPLPLRSVPVVVWNASRLDPGSETSSGRVLDRWRALRGNNGTILERVRCDLAYGYDDFYNWLDADQEVGALAYASAPRRDWLRAALNVGIPVMVWRRENCADPGSANDMHTALLRQLVSRLARTDPDALPAEVSRLRKDAMNPKTDERCGRALTLFWDDPARLPDPALKTWS